MLGMAVGTGNIWRFPRIVATNGGGSFLFAWVIFLLLWSVPLILVEFAIGKATLTQLTAGAQWGGQAYSEIVFFKDKKTLDNFKANNVEFSAQASAVAVAAGASADADYEEGVAVFTMTKGGLMLEASLGGQKFSYEPFE